MYISLSGRNICLAVDKGPEYVFVVSDSNIICAIIAINCIIIMSFRQHGYSWLSLATSPYHSSPLAGLQGYIPNPQIAAVCMFELGILLLLGYMWGSIGVLYLWARPASPAVSCMSGSSNLDIFRDGRQVAVWLVSCGVLPPGLVSDL